MDVRNFEEMSAKMSGLKEKKAKAEGVVEQMEGKMKELECKDIEDVEAKIKTFQSGIDSGEKKLDEVFGKLEKITDWDKI